MKDKIIRNRAIVTIMVLVVLLGNLSSTYAFNFDVTAEEEIRGREKKIQVLVDNGFIEGYSNGNLNLDKGIKRSEVAKLLTYANDMLDMSDSLAKSGGAFYDVNNSYWANGMINATTKVSAKSNGLFMINGYPDGSFKPENNVTYAELAKILLVLSDNNLSEEDLKNFDKDWPKAWINKADGFGLLDDVKISDLNKALNREEAFTMFYNAMSKIDYKNIDNAKDKNTKELDIKAENKKIDYAPKNEIKKRVIDENTVAGIISKKIQNNVDTIYNNGGDKSLLYVDESVDLVLESSKDIQVVNNFYENLKINNSGLNNKEIMNKAVKEISSIAINSFKTECLEYHDLKDNAYLNYGIEASEFKSNISYVSDGNSIIKVKINLTHNITTSMAKDKLFAKKQMAENKADEVINSLDLNSSGISDYEKVLKMHDYIINNAYYNNKNDAEKSVEEKVNDHSAYGVLVAGYGVCDSYAKAFQMMCKKTGIDCIYVTGSINKGGTVERHAWNKVNIDGNWYNVDVTWDDPIVKGKNVNVLIHDYFLKSDAQISKTHKQDANYSGYVATNNYK